MKLKLPKLVIKVMGILEKGGFEIYVVGGAVRDILSKKKVYDWDFTTNAKPEEIIKLFKDSFYDNNFGTVGIAEKHLGGKGEGVFEITTFRTESSYSDHRRPDKVKWGKSLDEDLTRRDFTINAMAIDNKLKIIDPFDGQKDLKNKLVRAVGKADKRFNEDALRMMRAIRIAAQLGFIIEEKTLKAINKNSSLINKIAKERVRGEFLKIIGSKFPKDGILILFASGLLEFIIPELIETRGVEQAGHHTKDVWNHSIDALEACPSPNPIVRLATLLHDIGKPKSKMNRGVGKEITFYNHEVIGARMVKVIARRLKMSKKQIDLLWLLVRWHMFAYDTNMTDKAIRRFIRRVGIENIDKMMDLRVGDRVGGGTKATSWRLEELKKRIKEVLYTPMQIKDLKVSGHDVMKILEVKGGRKVGEVLEKLFDEVMEDSEKNNREYLLKRIKEIT
ncbi:MAG: HDIG domain-containing protein [Patescibacteria group bacterium]|nr:HDIG domain-containing protein [Patescibacteria group bacterium]